MSRPRLTIGTFGTIGFQAATNGRVTARARYRDWDGKSRLVQATGNTKRAAEQRLKAKLAERTLYQPAGIGLTADSPFPDLVAYWLEDLDLEDRLSTTTRQLYERNMRTLVMPAFKDLTLREIGVARCDHFLKQLAKQSYNRAKQARVALRLALGLAVRHEGAAAQPDGSCQAAQEALDDNERAHSRRGERHPHRDRVLGDRALTFWAETGWAAWRDRRGDARHVGSHR